ncbi:MAG: terminase small subunit, partial [Planctomycetota bacterium]
MSEMTVKQKAFVEALPQNQWNGTKAAIKAGYSEKSAAVMACRLLKKPRIAAEIEKVKQRYLEELEQTDITIEELLKRLDRTYRESIEKGQY